jgi:hypothetical protein
MECTRTTLPLPLSQTIEQHKTDKNLNWREFNTRMIDLVSVTCNHNISLILLWQSVTADFTALFKTRKRWTRRVNSDSGGVI